MTKWSSPLLIVLVVVLTALLGCTGGCEPKPKISSDADETTPRVRVRLLAGVASVALRAEQPATLVDGTTGRGISAELPFGRTVELTINGDGWRLGSQSFSATSLVIQPAGDGTVLVNGLPYRGRYAVTPTGAGKFDVINSLDVESYLQGVLARELFPDWHPEAYRAQAIIARTYALYEVRTNPTGRTWDLNPDERSQVYGGMKAETPKANAAVAATRGLVAAHGPTGQERIFKAYFSSCCGGISNSAADVFNEPAIPPLSAKSNGTSCSISPRFSWPTVSLTKAELTRRIRAWGTKQGRPEANLPGVRSLQIAGTNPFGRPGKFMLIDSKNQQYLLTAEQVRWAVNSEPNGGPILFSGYFTPVDAGDAVRFTDGHGFGHGVGACQWCMQARALAGEPHQRIVTQAYPQSLIVQAY